MPTARVLLLLVLPCAACAGPSAARLALQEPGALPPAIEHRIRSARDELQHAPRLHSVWTELGEASLDAARSTLEPDYVHRARSAFERSLAIQDNLAARRGMVALAIFRQRFEDALVWAAGARADFPEAATVVGLHVEALLELGRVDEAATLLDESKLASDEFHARVARGRIELARGDVDRAVAAFEAAADPAGGAAAGLEAWTLVRAAEGLVEHGRAAEARAFLERALVLDPDGVDANLLAAEVEEQLGDPRAALERCGRILRDVPDPNMHAMAARLARAVGDIDRERRHARTAEQAFRRAIEAGETFTFAALARLLADLERDLDEAFELARRNAHIVRTEQARGLVERIALLRSRSPSGDADER